MSHIDQHLKPGAKYLIKKTVEFAGEGAVKHSNRVEFLPTGAALLVLDRSLLVFSSALLPKLLILSTAAHSLDHCCAAFPLLLLMSVVSIILLHSTSSLSLSPLL